MILRRFCSDEEYQALISGRTISNHTIHSKKRGTASTAVGFCFFDDDPEYAKHYLSGIVDFDWCLTLEVKPNAVRSCRGRYATYKPNGEVGPSEFKKEYCTEYYRLGKEFKLIEATDKYSSYCPGPKQLKKIFPWIVV